MSEVIAGITTSVDGYVAGPDDGPVKGLGEGGERLHYWVIGDPGLSLFIVTHRPDEQPPGDDFVFVSGVPEAIDRARAQPAARTSTSWAEPTSSARHSKPGS